MSIDETTKYIDRKRAERSEDVKQLENKPQQKDSRSAFDKILEQNQLMQQNILNKQLASRLGTEQALKKAEENKERWKEEKPKEKEREQEDKQAIKEKRGEQQGDMEGKKVVSKENGREQQEGGEKDSRGDTEKGREGKSKGVYHVSQELHGASLAGEIGKKFATELVKQQTAHTIKLPQEILDKLVRYIHVGKNKAGDKEIEISLHEAVFKGLRLLLSQKNGKVNIRFMTQNADTQALFSRSKGTIESALQSKGIAVGKIQVT